MIRHKNCHLSNFLRTYPLTRNVADHFISILDFSIDSNIPQRKLVDLGRIISRVIAADLVEQMGLKGFTKDLINNSILMIQQITVLLL